MKRKIIFVMWLTVFLFTASLAHNCIISCDHTHQAHAQQEIRNITHLSCPMGCGSVVSNTILGNFIDRDKWKISLRPQETPGYLYNIRELARNENRWKNTVIETENSILDLAHSVSGREEFFQDYLPEVIDTEFKLVWGLCVASQGMWYITFDPELESISDLKGKKIGLGLKTQSDWGMDAALFLEKAYGINNENSDLYFLGPEKMTDALLDNKVAAVCMGMLARNTPGEDKEWLPSSVYKKLEASGRKLHYISMDQWAIDKINKKYNTPYKLAKVPKGTLKNQKDDIYIGTDRVFGAVHASFPKDLARDYVLAYANTAPDLEEHHAVWKYVWTLEGMVAGLTEENTHPGAIEAFKELGLWEKRKEFEPYEPKWLKE